MVFISIHYLGIVKLEIILYNLALFVKRKKTFYGDISMFLVLSLSFLYHIPREMLCKKA